MKQGQWEGRQRGFLDSVVGIPAQRLLNLVA